MRHEGPSPPAIDLDGLGLDRGAHLLLDRALAALPPGGRLAVRGRDPALRVHLPAWCRARGHQLDGISASEPGEPLALIVRGDADIARWHGAERAGDPSPRARWRTPRPPGAWPRAAHWSRRAAPPCASTWTTRT